jgi:hypothetical protein
MFVLSNPKAAKPTLPRSGGLDRTATIGDLRGQALYPRIQYNARPRNPLEGGADRVKARVGAGGFLFFSVENDGVNGYNSDKLFVLQPPTKMST